MRKKRLGVNIDHVATIRNARGENYPDPLKGALIAEKNGADSVTIHLREDRRHIRDIDLRKIMQKNVAKKAINGNLHEEILAAYWQCGFYIFEGIFEPEELSEIETDVFNIIDRLPVKKGSPVDK